LITLPRWLTDGWLLLVVAVAVVALVVGTWRERLALLTVVAATIALPIGALVATTDTHSVGWQGRYSLPVAIGVPILAGWTIGRSSLRTQLVTRLLTVAVAAFAGVALVVAHQRLMTRLVVGLPNSLFANLRHGGNWNGPLNPVLLFTAAVVVSVAIVTWMLLVAFTRTPAHESRHQL
jgi:Predicted membrane protein (DUF2142)